LPFEPSPSDPAVSELLGIDRANRCRGTDED
jgi:hypothetical protein